MLGKQLKWGGAPIRSEAVVRSTRLIFVDDPGVFLCGSRKRTTFFGSSLLPPLLSLPLYHHHRPHPSRVRYQTGRRVQGKEGGASRLRVEETFESLKRMEVEGTGSGRWTGDTDTRSSGESIRSKGMFRYF